MTTGTPRVFNRGTTALAHAALVASLAATLVISDAPDSTGGKIASRSRFTDVFVWRDGRWQGVSAQETHVPEGK